MTPLRLKLRERFDWPSCHSNRRDPVARGPLPMAPRYRVDAPSMRPLRVLLLAGGPSAEREISIASGRAVRDALRLAGHTVSVCDPLDETIAHIHPEWFDVAFIALHGRYGEDGTVQEQLEAMGLPYTGSGPHASALAFDKSQAKTRFRIHQVPTPAWSPIRREDSPEIWQAAARQLGLPVVAKPDRQGSSIGVGFALSMEEIPFVGRAALRFDVTGLLEQAIAGEEWTVPLLDQECLPPIRIGTARAFFDYEAKYLCDDTAYEFPVDVPISQIDRILTTAQQAVQALGCTGLSRVDLRVDPSGQPWVLEVNTIPGLTDHSLSPKSAAHAGIDFPEFCTLLCERALHPAGRPASGPHIRPALTPQRHTIPIRK